jgi:hypothetical protein
MDFIARLKFLSSLDMNLGYHQISMHPDYKKKTSFIIDKGTFYYKAMAFEPKCDGAIY